MRIDTRIVLKDIEGNEITYVDLKAKDNSEVNKPLTIKKALYDVLNNFASDEIATANDKEKSFGLSVRLYSADEIDLSAEDIVYIKQRAGKVAGSIVYGRICEIIERKEQPQVN